MKLFILESVFANSVKYLNTHRMQKLTFKKDRLVASFWDTEAEDWQERDLAESSLPLTWFLPYETYVDEGVSLADMLRLLKPHESYINLVFIHYLKGIMFGDLVDELISTKSQEEFHKIDAVCLMWVSQVKPIEGDEENLLDTQPVLMGLEMSEDDEGEDDEFHSIHEVTPTQLLESEFVIDDLIEFYTHEDPDETLLSGVTSWTLFDVLRSVLSELSTYCLVSGLLKRVDSESVAPIDSIELFDHLSDLDKFFNSGQIVKRKK